MPPKPEPISNPFEAGKLNIALPKSASSRSKTGSPQPGGTPRATHSITPPTLSPARRIFSISRIILRAAPRSGQRTMLDSTCFGVTLSTSTAARMRCDLFDVGDDGDLELFAQNFPRDRAGGDAADGFPRAGAPAALPVADAEFGLVSVIGVGRPEFRRPSRCMPPGGRPRFCTHMEMGVPSVFPSNVPERISHPVAFLARGDDGGLAGPAAVQVRLNVRLGQAQARRAAVNHHAHAAAVGFAPGGDAKKESE